MVLREERELVVEYGKKLSQEKLSVGTSGNISVYNAEEGLMAITPSGMDYMKLKPEDVVVMDLDSHLVDSDRKPSSEWALHTGFYLKRKISARWYIPIRNTAQFLRYFVSRSVRCIMQWQESEPMKFHVLHIICMELRNWHILQWKSAEKAEQSCLQIMD